LRHEGRESEGRGGGIKRERERQHRRVCNCSLATPCPHGS
jgi:hypothetical protein